MVVPSARQLLLQIGVPKGHLCQYRSRSGRLLSSTGTAGNKSKFLTTKLVKVGIVWYKCVDSTLRIVGRIL
jgi:hypothetical protein